MKTPGFVNVNTGVVAGTQIVSGAIAFLGAAHFLGETLPKPVEKFKNFIAARVVEPHLETFFEKYFHRMLHAEDVALEKRGALSNEKPYASLTRAERADRIAGVITRESFAFLADTGVTLGLQALSKDLINKRINPRLERCGKKTIGQTNIEPGKIVFTGATVQLGALAVMGTLLAKPSEWIYHKLTDILPKITSMDPVKAKEFARHTTYVGLPGMLGALAELSVAEKEFTHPH